MVVCPARAAKAVTPRMTITAPARLAPTVRRALAGSRSGEVSSRVDDMVYIEPRRQRERGRSAVEVREITTVVSEEFVRITKMFQVIRSMAFSVKINNSSASYPNSFTQRYIASFPSSHRSDIPKQLNNRCVVKTSGRVQRR